MSSQKADFRITLKATPRQYDWVDVPVVVDLNLGDLAAAAGQPRDSIDRGSIRVKDSDGREVPFRLDSSLRAKLRIREAGIDSAERCEVSWVKTDKGQKDYTVTFSTLGETPLDLPEDIPLVGCGDSITVGRRGTIGQFMALGTRVIWPASKGERPGILTHVMGFDGGLFWAPPAGGSESGRLCFGKHIRLQTTNGLIVGSSIAPDGEAVVFEISVNTLGFRKLLGGAALPCLGDSEPIMLGDAPLSTGRRPTSGARGYEMGYGDLHDDWPSDIDMPGRITAAAFVDWDGDGVQDLMVALKTHGKLYNPKWLEDREEVEELGFEIYYARHNLMDGPWQGGDTSGWIYFFRNVGTNESPRFERGEKLKVEGVPLDSTGITTVIPVDWDGDGDWDLVISTDVSFELLYIENTGNSGAPEIAAPVPIRDRSGRSIFIPNFITRCAIGDLDADGVPDIVIGRYDGEIVVCRHVEIGSDGPICDPPEPLDLIGSEEIMVGGFATPTACDWDGDGDIDIVTGGSFGIYHYIVNDGTRREPLFRQKEQLKAEGAPIVISPGRGGYCQGPQARLWGYITPVFVDWDGDGLVDIVSSDSLGKHRFFRNIGSATQPQLAKDVRFTSEGKELNTVARSRPAPIDWDNDGELEYVAIDRDAELAVYRKIPGGKPWEMGRGEKILRADGSPFRLNARMKLLFCDWDGDGDLDFLCGVGPGALVWWENVGTREDPIFAAGPPVELFRGVADHSCSPEAVDWNGDGHLDIIAGSDNGRIYYFHRAYIEDDLPRLALLSVEVMQEDGNWYPVASASGWNPRGSVVAVFDPLPSGPPHQAWSMTGWGG